MCFGLLYNTAVWRHYDTKEKYKLMRNKSSVSEQRKMVQMLKHHKSPRTHLNILCCKVTVGPLSFRCGRRNCQELRRLEMLPRWSAVKTWRSCMIPFSWLTSVSSTPSMATSWGKGMSQQHNFIFMIALIISSCIRMQSSHTFATAEKRNSLFVIFNSWYFLAL